MKENTVYVIQEIPGTRDGKPRINIIGAAEYGSLKFLLPELSQIIFSPGPLIFKLRKALKNYTREDYLLLTGDLCYNWCGLFNCIRYNKRKIQAVKMG